MNASTHPDHLPNIPGHHTRKTRAGRLNKGDIIIYHDLATRVLECEIRMGVWTVDLKLERRVPLLTVDARDVVFVLKPFPKEGDFATLHLPADKYPFIVRKVSPSGRKLELQPLNARLVSGRFGSHNEVVEYSCDPSFPVQIAHWSPKRFRYQLGGTPLTIGTARYYQAPEV